VIALLLALALGQDDLVGAGLDPLTRGLFQDAVRDEQADSCRRAISGYRLVLRQEPGYVPASLGLGRCYLVVGEPEAAERTLRSIGHEADAAEALARLLEQLERPLEAAAWWRKVQTLRFGSGGVAAFAHEARALLAGDEVDAAIAALTRHLELAEETASESLAGDLAIDLAEVLVEAERPDEARFWLQAWLVRWPGGERSETVMAMLDRLVVEALAAGRTAGAAEPLGQKERLALETARRLLARERLDEATATLEALLQQAPRAPEAWAALGDLAWQRGDMARAEQAYLTAKQLAPEEPDYRIRLGILLVESYGGRRHAEAAEEFRRALALRPSAAELHYRLGRVHQESGDPDAAALALARYLALEPQGRFAEDAAARLATLNRVAPEPPSLEQLASSRPDEVPEEAWRQLNVARVYLYDRDDDASAEVAVRLALAEAPAWVDALNLLATLQLRAGEDDEALATWRDSLAARPDQPLVLLDVGRLVALRGDRGDAIRHFERAATMGEADGHYELARMADEDGAWWEARELLKSYFALASGGPRHDQAVALQERLDARARTIVGGAMCGLALLGVLGLGFRHLRYGGWTLRQLLRAFPDAYADVARVLGAMRHEVIKHNTTVLPKAADGLAVGDDAAARDAAEILFSGARGGVIARWTAYIGELEAVGRSFGVRLNLRHLDPELAPMCRAFRELSRLERSLRAGSVAPERLHRLAHVLNQEGYRALGAILREAGLIVVEESLFRGCWEAVVAEPAFAGQRLPRLEIWACDEVLEVRMGENALQDVVTNLLRNALGAVLDDRDGEGRLGLSLEVEDDPVTGLESVLIRVLDNARTPLTDAMIRGRFVDRGFGLTVELLERAEGSVSVATVHEGGFEKAVTVCLPRAEGCV